MDRSIIGLTCSGTSSASSGRSRRSARSPARGRPGGTWPGRRTSGRSRRTGSEPGRPTTAAALSLAEQALEGRRHDRAVGPPPCEATIRSARSPVVGQVDETARTAALHVAVVGGLAGRRRPCAPLSSSAGGGTPASRASRRRPAGPGGGRPRSSATTPPMLLPIDDRAVQAELSGTARPGRRRTRPSCSPGRACRCGRARAGRLRRPGGWIAAARTAAPGTCGRASSRARAGSAGHPRPASW